jgi:hypothetical protein
MRGEGYVSLRVLIKFFEIVDTYGYFHPLPD